jgi:hypothetical protein
MELVRLGNRGPLVPTQVGTDSGWLVKECCRSPDRTWIMDRGLVSEDEVNDDGLEESRECWNCAPSSGECYLLRSKVQALEAAD